jgi:hypothetical protein
MARTRACIAVLTAIGIGQACENANQNDKRSEQRKGRKEPICAVQDCATGKILDDGCDETGRCASCINSCTSGEPPSAAPKAQ